MTTKGVIAVVFVTPHLTDVELMDPDTPVTFCGRQVIGRKQMSVRDYLISTHLYYGGRQRPWQQLDSCSRSFSFTKPSYLQNCFDSDGVQIPAHLKAQEIPVTTVRLPGTTATLADHLPNKTRTTVDQRNWNNPQCWHDLSGSEHSAGPC